MTIPIGASQTRHRYSASLYFFFFSSRRRHTRFDCDWSSDVCSSDLGAAGERERLRHELTELSVTHHEHAVVGADRDLLLDLERGRERLGEHGGVRGHGVGDRVQVFGRQDEVLGERAVPAHDAEHRASRAMRAPAREARTAHAAHGVDLTDHAAADERRWTALDDADELVAGDAGVRVVPARELDIGVADSGAQHAYERFARGRLGDPNVVPHAQAAILQPESPHAGNMPPESLTGRRASWWSRQI